MEGITRWPGSRAAEYASTHPGVTICQVEGIWRAWITDPQNPAAGHLLCGQTLDELLDRLADG